MKKNPYIILALLALGLLGCETTKNANPSQLSDFREFFAKTDQIGYEEVIEEFGQPTRRGPLFLGETEDDVRTGHSWWYYELSGGDLVGVQVDDSKVKGVFRFHTNPSGENITETIRPDPTISKTIISNQTIEEQPIQPPRD